MARIAHIRTWTYISHRADWLRDADTWQSRTRELEDKISDALHNSLTQRFVDRRAAALTRMKEDDDYSAVVGVEGDVSVGSEFVGHLDGFRFVPDASAAASGRQALLSAANTALRGALDPRVDALCNAPDGVFSVDEAGKGVWAGATIARLKKGLDIVSPAVSILQSDYLSTDQRERMRKRLLTWVNAQLEDLERLIALVARRSTGWLAGWPIVSSRGLARSRVQVLRTTRYVEGGPPALRSCGVRIGPETLFLPTLVKPKAVQWRALLWALFNDKLAPPFPRWAGHCTRWRDG